MTCLTPCSQAALASFAAVNERHGETPESYRVGQAQIEYPKQLKKICGPDGAGDGEYGNHPFPIKRRPPNAGGDFTFAKSIELRPQAHSTIYKTGKMACSKSLNIYNPLCKKLLVDGALRSGWQEEDLYKAMLFALKGLDANPLVPPVMAETEEDNQDVAEVFPLYVCAPPSPMHSREIP